MTTIRLMPSFPAVKLPLFKDRSECSLFDLRTLHEAHLPVKRNYEKF
jgi:hypothetical protein